MTRKVRFSSFLTRGVFAAAAVLAGAPQARAGEVPFVTQPPIATDALLAISVAVEDMDGDGDLDVIAASAQDDTVRVYLNVAGDGSSWQTFIVITQADGAFRGTAADVDGDADQDVVIASYLDNTVRWAENVNGDASTWTNRPIITSTLIPVAVAAGDVDNDGDTDVVSASAGDDTVLFLENTAGNGSAWAPITITTTSNEAFSVGLIDVDGDGSLDVLLASYLDDKLDWFANTAGDGSVWTPHTITTSADGARSVFPADVDGDGDPDALSASFFDDEVAWHKNLTGDGSAWQSITITTNANAARAVVAGDLDGDGDKDVASASTFDDTIGWHENVVGDGSVWISRNITTAADGAFSVALGDLDNDGDLDVVSASGGDDTVAWYRNETIHSSACFTPTRLITDTLPGPTSVWGGDVDGDGDQDLMAASGADGTIVWFANDVPNSSFDPAIVIATAALQAAHVAAGDVDGDGDLDAVWAASGSNTVAWSENSAGDGSTWSTFTITSSAPGAAAVAPADVDGDADLDVCWAASATGTIACSLNVAGNGSAWNTITITSSAPGAASVAAGDVDKDADLDVCWAASATGTIACSLNVAGDGTVWSTIPITTGAAAAAWVALGDVDGDGNLDLLAVSPGDDRVTWFENSAGDGSAWTPHVIGASTVDPSRIFAIDLDVDGDVDAVVTSDGDDAVIWFENGAGDGSTWTPRSIATAMDPVSVFPADVDKDGRLDVFSASGGDDRLVWHPNRGGQFSLAATDTAPATANDGDLVPMLRVGATHLGRAGDHDLELSSLGLLFEEAPGDPLTSAEGNALVESLRIYRDANGNGSFEPASDALVASLANLALAGGVQTVSFADADANVQVGFGAPRSYFVVSELTANAGLQSPNRFRITHLGLGPSASTAEDRSFDIPLRPACPEDQASGIVQAVNALSAILSASKSVSGHFHEGEPVSYTIVVTNDGPGLQVDSATDELQDTVPAGLTVTGADDGGDPGTVSVVGNDVRWNGALPSSASVTVTIQATINAGTLGSVISNQGTVTYDSDGNGTGETTAPTDDPALPGAADPTSFAVTVPTEGDLVHGAVRDLDLAAPGPADVDLFGFRQEPRSSYEVVVDATTGDLGSGGSGPALELVAGDGVTVVQSSTPAGAGPSRSLRFENASAAPVLDRIVRVTSQGCTTNCTPEDRYRVRAWETTLGLARFNNSASQVTVLVLQNPTEATVTGNAWLRNQAGVLVAAVPFSIPPRASFVLNTSTVAPGVGGTLTVSHDAPYGGLGGKAVSVEPGTGFTFDTPLLPRPR